MTEKTGSPTECKILQFPEPKPRGLVTWGDLQNNPGLMVTKASVELTAPRRCIAEVFSELVKKATEQSKVSGVPVYLLVETAVRQYGGMNIHVAKLLGDALKELRRAHDAQRDRLAAQDREEQSPRLPDQGS